MKLFRGDDSAARPELASGVWLTDDRQAAEFYGNVHSYDICPDGVLDLRALGVGDDDCRDALIDELQECGVAVQSFRFGWVELYQLCEREDFRAAVRTAGFSLVAVQQWNADLSDQPYDSWMVA